MESLSSDERCNLAREFVVCPGGSACPRSSALLRLDDALLIEST